MRGHFSKDMKLVREREQLHVSRGRGRQVEGRANANV